MAAKGYGQVSGANQSGKSKKMAIMGISSLILVAMVVAVAVGVSKNSNGGSSDAPASEIKTSSKSITTICQPTDYKESCISSLTAVAGDNTTDPKTLIKLAFEVAIEKVNVALNESTVLKEAEKDPKAAKALENCKELMDYSIDDLKTSLKQFEDFDVSKLDDFLDDIKIWLSGSLTYQDTCVDGFDGVESDAGQKMKKAIQGGSELTSNALAIVNEISSIFASLDLPFLQHRRLLSTDEDGAGVEDQTPSWVSNGRRGLLSESPETLKPDAVVAKDGSGKFKSINGALATVPKKSPKPFVIYIKAGVYEEQVMVDKSMTNVVMIGDGPTKTKITGNKNFIDGVTTFKTATVAVVGNGFMAKNIGFENSAGAEKHQAVALRVQSDESIFFNCQMDAYQDTLYVHTHRQFYRDCTISGTIDFIFGNSAVVFQNCKIVVRKPMANQMNIVTAQGRKDRREPTGIIIHNCHITADPELFPVRQKLKSYLGRPWKQYSRTFFIQSEIDDLIQPVGWLPWEGDFALNTCFYAEYGNRGPGSDTTNRAKWRGIKSLTPERAQKFTVGQFIQGNKWLKGSGVPFTPGLLNA